VFENAKHFRHSQKCLWHFLGSESERDRGNPFLLIFKIIDKVYSTYDFTSYKAF